MSTKRKKPAKGAPEVEAGSPRDPRTADTVLRDRLAEAEETLNAIRSGEVDAIVVGGPEGDRIFTLTGADHSYRVLMDAMSQGVATLGDRHLVTYCNSRFAELLGAPVEKIVGTSLLALVPESAGRRLSALLEAGAHAVSKAEFTLPRPEGGALLPVLLAVSQVTIDGGAVLCVIGSDLTELKEREQALARERAERDASLRESEARYRRIVETAVEGIWLLDAEFKGTFVNRALAEMLGRSPSELRGRAIFEFMEPESGAAARRLLERRRRYSEIREFGFLRADGRELWAVLSSSPIQSDDGQNLGSVVMVSDVSERRKMQAQLLLADRMSSLGTLSAGVAHEINNPLAYVIGSLDLLASRLPMVCRELDRDTCRWLEQQIERAREGSERVRTIVRDLKSFSRADEEKVTAIDLHRSLETSLTLVWNEIKHRARLVKDFAAVPAVRANEARLGQVFINLLVNAAQAIPEGDIDNNELRVVGRTDAAGNAVVEIHDTGCGIPAENLGRIFEPFFTTKPVGEGTGLGLAICHGIITSMGGSLTAESTVGKGSVFRVVLPGAKMSTSAARPAAKLQDRAGTTRGRVLVIDDEADLTDVTREGLAPFHDVLTTDDARQALEWIAGGDKFDLILCDMMMPAMTGMEFYTRLQQQHPAQAARVVFMTGGAFTPRAREFLARLPNLRLEKPFDLEHVLAVVNAHVGGTSRQDGGVSPAP